MPDFIVTGGAGFIGSAITWGLNQRGEKDILIVDSVDHAEKKHNVDALSFASLMPGDDFRKRLASGEFNRSGVKTVFHLGAISSTTEQDWKKFQHINVDFSKEVIEWCKNQHVRCIYASSGATYGDGRRGYRDDHSIFEELEPLNPYGKSKLMVDIWARDAGYLNEVVGVRYFNVFGPNEWHKGEMASVVQKKFSGAAAGKPVTLFKSYDTRYKDGDSKRDFIYVKDCVDATLFFLDHPNIAGIYNIGTGHARSWNDLVRALFHALGSPPAIEYVDMPEQLRGQYQYFTEADISKLAKAGYTKNMASLEDTVADYVKNHLIPHKHL